METIVKKILLKDIKPLFKLRNKESFKNTYGHVLIIAGSKGMTGASVLCANAALRSGAGLVSLGCPDSQQPIVAAKVSPEIMTIGLPEGKSGFIGFESLKIILDFIKERNITSLVIGPGLGRNSTEIFRVIKGIILSVSLPVLLDADGIIETLKDSKAKIIITPHPGELSRITGFSVDEIQSRRSEIASLVAKKNDIICVLKGHETVIADGKNIFINTTGNPGMATGGSGDVLSGMIAAFIKQVEEPSLLSASLAGVFIHGTAGDIAAEKKTEIGLIAGDIIDNIPEALTQILQ